MDWFEKLIIHFQKDYFVDPMMAFFEIIAIVTVLLFARKDKIGMFFVGYLVFDFTILLIDNYMGLSAQFTKRDINHFRILTSPVISLVELLVYYYFFKKTIQNVSVVKTIKLLLLIFFGA